MRSSIGIKAAWAGLIWVVLVAGCKRQEEIHPIGEFLPESEAFWNVVPREAVIERIGIAFEFTEGPTWHPRGYLVLSDIPANTIYQWTGKKFVVFRQPSKEASGLLFESGGDLLACEHESRSITRMSPTGMLTTVVDHYQGKRLNSPNDLCQSSLGAIYFTDPPWGLPELNNDPGKEIPFSGVYKWHHGELTLIDSTLSWPKGIALSPDENYLYVANVEILETDGEDQYDAFWMRYRLNAAGEVEDKSVFYRAPDTSLPGGPDGMKVDQLGNLFVTGPGGILVLNTAGNHLGTISLPIPPTNLAFGPKEQELFVTARSTVYRITMER